MSGDESKQERVKKSLYSLQTEEIKKVDISLSTFEKQTHQIKQHFPISIHNGKVAEPRGRG